MAADKPSFDQAELKGQAAAAIQEARRLVADADSLAAAARKTTADTAQAVKVALSTAARFTR